MKNLKKKKGFTIVELVIVIAVIGVLSAILIPTFSSLIGESREKALQLGLRNSYAAYAVDASEDAEEETAVFLSTKADLSAEGVQLYKLGDNGVWEEVKPVTAANYESVSATEYNGYYVFKAKA